MSEVDLPVFSRYVTSCLMCGEQKEGRGLEEEHAVQELVTCCRGERGLG